MTSSRQSRGHDRRYRFSLACEFMLRAHFGRASRRGGVRSPQDAATARFLRLYGRRERSARLNLLHLHPPVPASALAADINLDQLRPLFPLHLLTALALGDTTLGTTAPNGSRRHGHRLTV